MGTLRKHQAGGSARPRSGAAAAGMRAWANARAAGEFFAGAVLVAFAEVENALDAEGRLREQIGFLAVAVDEAEAALGELPDRLRRLGPEVRVLPAGAETRRIP